MPLFSPLRPLLRTAAPSTRRNASAAAAFLAGSAAYRAFYTSRIAVLATTLGASAFTAGMLAVKSIHPGTGPVDTGPLHRSGHPEDEAALSAGAEMLRANTLYRQLAADPEWQEELEDVPHTLPAERRRTRLMSGTYWGHRKITVNRRFTSKDGKRSKSLLSIGTALCGHPNVVHGGVLATVLDEALGRLAISQFPRGKHAVTARLEVKYRAPTRARDGWFNRHGLVVVTTDVVEMAERKVKVRGDVRDLDGKLLVESEALFVVPKGWQPRPLAEH
ncbi:HotDog domain-containing protein [Sphaerosporella brunnea]|uniref:HotDog domain-containing protein n=1 Tax=Sphaerosporella brunnea TaxID=1250544 RepID=A0A5J5EGN9_9PEZI|nr:HotDog domain-containing protein [Sphaerosporella brunnea]KAA8894228.1 HotDog domain-containing protein [Sphaerosporella brunnea]